MEPKKKRREFRKYLEEYEHIECYEEYASQVQHVVCVVGVE